MPNFAIVVDLCGKPWPFKWGPFGRRRILTFKTDGADIHVHQAGDPNQIPITVECYSSYDICTTTVDFKRGSRLKRRTHIR